MSDKTKPSILKNWRTWIAVLVIPIIGFAAWRGGLTVYDLFLKWRSERLRGEAVDFFAAGKNSDSLRAVAKSLECNPANPESLRLLGKLQLVAGEDLAAMDTFKKLSATRAFTAADAETYARLAGRLKNWEVADGLLKALRAGPKSLETALLDFDLSVMRGDTPRAEACLREAVGLDSSAKSRDMLSDFLIANRLDIKTTPEVYDLLLQTNRIQTPAGAQFLATALEKNLAPPVEVPKWIEQLRSHPNKTEGMLLIADTADVRSDPAVKPKVVDGLCARLRNAPLSDRQAGVFWLLANGEPGRAADLIQAGEAVQDAELFNAWLDALALSKKPDAVLAALDGPNPLKDWRKALQRGRAQRLTGHSAQANAAYNQAMTLAQVDPQSELEMVAFLGKAGERVLFENALSRLLLDPDQAAHSYKTFMPIVRSWRDTPGLRKFCEILIGTPGLSEEEHAQVHNEIDYCEMILGRKVEVAHVKSHAGNLSSDMRYQITQAFALLRAGQNELAVDELVITKAPPDDPFLLARHKAAQAVALAASGDRERAQIHFQSVSEFLSPQEIAFVRSFLKK